MNIKKKTGLLLLSFVSVFFLLYLSFFTNFYLFINDTSDRVSGTLIGSSSPSKKIDLSAHSHAFFDYGWWRDMELLRVASRNLNVEPSFDTFFLKIVRLSQLDYETSIAMQNDNSEMEIASSNSNTPTNWKMYNNDKLGYHIKYPTDWNAEEYNENEVYISYPEWRQMPEGGGSVVISVNDKNLEQYIDEYNSSDVLDDGTALSKIVKQESYTFNGISAHKLVGTTAIGLNQSFIFISHANKTYIIRFHDYDETHLDIIETFNFDQKKQKT